jgi:hypothetical protein
MAVMIELAAGVGLCIILYAVVAHKDNYVG